VKIKAFRKCFNKTLLLVFVQIPRYCTQKTKTYLQESTTNATSSMVILVSAMLVDKMICNKH